MRTRLSLALSILAVVIAVLGATPLGRAAADALPIARFAQNAGAVNGIKADREVKTGQLLPLNASAKYPAEVLPKEVVLQSELPKPSTFKGPEAFVSNARFASGVYVPYGATTLPVSLKLDAEGDFLAFVHVEVRGNSSYASIRCWLADSKGVPNSAGDATVVGKVRVDSYSDGALDFVQPISTRGSADEATRQLRCDAGSVSVMAASLSAIRVSRLQNAGT